MKLVMTLMVRDEADIIAEMIQFHLNQGIDLVIVTDNGSVDGTVEILEALSDDGSVDLRHDPVHQKQQGESVTGMARDAYALHGADWVINADADEFWTAADTHVTLRDAFAGINTQIQSFTVPVIDMIGEPALKGTGLQRLRYRDLRTPTQLNAVGLLAHSTHDAVHIGSPDVTVAQGNHFVSLQSRGEPDHAHRIEVRHFPWRSWSQYSRKVENAGRAYESQTLLKPSPNHHGMRDYQRLQDGTLLAHYLRRHPTEGDLRLGLAGGIYVEDSRVSASAHSNYPDILFDQSLITGQSAFLGTVQSLENELVTVRSRLERADLAAAAIEAKLDLSFIREEVLRSELAAEKNRWIVRLLDQTTAVARRMARRL